LSRKLARLELRAGRPAAARQLLQASLQTLPDAWGELWELGNLLVELDQPAEAQGVIQRLQEGREAWSADYLRARLLVRQGGRSALAEAHRRLEKVEELHPAWAAVPLLRAEAYEREGHSEKALASYQTALQRGEGRPKVVRR